MKLSDFRTDSRAIADGTWLRVGPAYGDLEILTRGFTDEFTDAQTARLARAAEPYNGDVTRIPNAERRLINAGLLADFLVLDVRNLVGDDGQAVTREAFGELLGEAQYGRLMRACWEAAAKVSALTAVQLEAAMGNSARPSGSTSLGVSSGNA